MVELTEKLLMNAGGWQAMKQARALADSGRVAEARYEPPRLTGLVREGQVEYRAGLKIESASRIDNLCRCRESQRFGTVCAHSLAVGLSLLRPRAAGPVAATPATAAPPADEIRIGVSGESVKLFVRLPPATAAVWGRESLTVAVEAEFGGRSMPPEGLPKGKPLQADAADLALIEQLRKLTRGRLAGMLMLPMAEFLGLLEVLRGHPRVTFGRADRAVVEARGPRPILSIRQRDSGGAEVVAKIPDAPGLLRAGLRIWQRDGTVFRPVLTGLPAAYAPLLAGPVRMEEGQFEAFVASELPVLRAFFDIEGDVRMDEPAGIESPAFMLAIEGSLNHLTARLRAKYGAREETVGAAGSGRGRNAEEEAGAMTRLRRSGFSEPDKEGQMTLRTERNILTFFAVELPRLQREWTVTTGSRFRNVTANIDRVRPEMQFRASGENWFDLEVGLASDSGERLPATEIQRLLQSGQRHLRLRNGRTAVFDDQLLEDFQQVLADCDPKQTRPGHYRIDRLHAGFLAATLEDNPELRAMGDRPAAPGAGQSEVHLGSLDDVLRPYQKQGVAWMVSLAANGLGGILADEMGLGKTVQALAFLRSRRAAGITGSALIVAPSSLVYNWEREARRFTPELEPLAITGGDRKTALASVGEADLIITSYPLLRRDIARYQGHRFSAVILDEAQHIKNPDTQNAQAATALAADTRFVLTGTPVENSVRDLWSLMNFAVPDYLGDRDAFRDRYEQPISRDPAAPEMSRLKRRLRPFMLRRLKRSVYTELPEKVQQVALCEMTVKQRRVYEDLLLHGRSEVERVLGEKGAGQARMTALNLLLRLRQVCCAPAIVGLDDGAKESGKLDLFQELLEEAVDGGHKILVFSQFVSVLRLLREKLESAGMDFCYLDGTTKDRAGVVDRFQGSDVPVFLISLKAGGTGLNLTAADTVIHFDPWWNPAVEDQATDRAHRIGQERVVTAYKLITRGTVEEKILALQQRKRAVIDAAVDSEEPLMTGLDLSEIQELLE